MTATLFSYLLFTALLLAAALALAVLYRRYPVRKIYRSKVHLESAFDSINEPIAVINGNYRILRANAAYARLVKRPFPEILGHVCHDILRGRAAPCEDCLLKEALDRQARCIIERSPHPAGEGAVTFSFYPFRWRQSEVAASAVEHIRDITELEHLKNSLEAKNRMLEETALDLQKAQASIVEEIDMARQVQEGILLREIPAIPGLRVDLSYHPIEAIGGDIYDFIPFSPSRVGVFIGDASGHGLPAAFVATISKMSLYNHTKTELPANRLLDVMNKDLIRHLRSGHYLTCFWGVFNAVDNTFTFARAGHPKPFVIREGGEVLSLHSAGTFIGIIEGITFQEQVFQCRKGDRIYLYTDGVYVVTLRDGQRTPGLTGDSFQKIIERCNTRPFEEIIPAVKEELGQFTYEDDYTLIVLEVTGDSWADRVRSEGGFAEDDDFSLVVVNDYAHEAEECNRIFQAMRECGYEDRDIYSLGICLSELVHNAIHHGNRDDKTLSVFVGYTVTETRVRIAVIDQGEGFNLAGQLERDDTDATQGKGLHLVKRFTSEITGNKAGNCVIITRNRG